MSCENKPCSAESQFTNTKDGRKFCSPECASGFYKAPSVRVAGEDEFVEVSKNHPAFNIMSAKEKETFLSFGRDKAVGLGSDRQDVHRVHVAIKEALDMIGAGEDDKKRKQEDDDLARKRQALPEPSFLDVLPADIQVITLRYDMMARLNLLRKDPPGTPNRLSPDFFKSPLFLDLFEKNPSRLPMLFNIQMRDSFSTFAMSTSAYQSFAIAVQVIVLEEKGEQTIFCSKLMKVVSDAWKVVWNLGKNTLVYSPEMIRNSIVRFKKPNSKFSNTSVEKYIDDNEIMLCYAMWMNNDIVGYPIGTSGSFDGTILFLMAESVRAALSSWKIVGVGSGWSFQETKVLGAEREQYVANLVYLACWLMKDLMYNDSNFNPMADGYIFIEFVRQIAYTGESVRCKLFSDRRIIEAYEIFIRKVLRFQPMGRWAQGEYQVHPYNPFRVHPKFINNIIYDDPTGGPYVTFYSSYTKWHSLEGRRALEQLSFETDHIAKYASTLQMECFHVFPGKYPISGKQVPMPKDDAWKKIARGALYSYIQGTERADVHLCTVMETKMGEGLWDIPIIGTLAHQRFADRLRHYSSAELENAQKKMDKESIERLCSYKDKNGNVASFDMSDDKSVFLFETLLNALKEKYFVTRFDNSHLDVIDYLNDPMTCPISVLCYRKNMPSYAKTMGDPFKLYVRGESYVFTLYNYVNGLVPVTREESHSVQNMIDLKHLRDRPRSGQHRLILYTAPDRKSQTVLYVFGENQKVDWERHPNVQMIYRKKYSSVTVTIKNPDGSLSVYRGDQSTIMIPADTEHLIEGSNTAFLSTYFPAEDEPVFKINGFPVYKEWGQPRLPPPRARPEQAAPMEQ